MTCDLTRDGLCGCFDPLILATLIQLPLVKRHLSAEDYIYCQSICAQSMQSVTPPVKVALDKAILPLSVLEKSDKQEVAGYLNIDAVKKAYIRAYGLRFQQFLSRYDSLQQDLSTESFGFSPPNVLPFLRGSLQERKLIFQIQAAMALPLEAFTHAILEQDFYLQEIAAVITYQATKAHQLIAAFEANDIAYKKTVINLGLSVIKVGLGVVNGAELINVCQSLSTLAMNDEMVMDTTAFTAVIGNIRSLVLATHWQVLQQAEKQLLSTALTEDLSVRWVMYRAQVFRQANAAIQQVIETCLKSDDFLRCIMRETCTEYPNLTDDALVIFSTEKVRAYVANIASALQDQIEKIGCIRDVIVSAEGSEKIEAYFEKMGLINYTLDHENSSSALHRFLTKKLGHRLSFYFPEVIFQKKWAPITLFGLLHRDVVYSKRKISVKEYQERRQKTPVVLGLFSNSSRVKKSLFMNLEEQIPHLNDCLIEDLQQSTVDAAGVFLPNGVLTEQGGNVRRYSFKQQRLSLFSFTEEKSDSPIAKRRRSTDSGVVLLSSRSIAQ